MKEVLAYSASEQSGAHTKVLIILGLWNPLVPTHSISFHSKNLPNNKNF